MRQYLSNICEVTVITAHQESYCLGSADTSRGVRIPYPVRTRYGYGPDMPGIRIRSHYLNLDMGVAGYVYPIRLGWLWIRPNRVFDIFSSWTVYPKPSISASTDRFCVLPLLVAHRLLSLLFLSILYKMAQREWHNYYVRFYVFIFIKNIVSLSRIGVF
jgi:hypothetical protein